MKVLLLFGIQCFVFLGEIWVSCKLDKQQDRLRINKRALIVSVVFLFFIALLRSKESMAVGIASGPFWGSLMAAAYSDRLIKQAYDFYFYIAGLSGIITLLVTGVLIRDCIGDIVIFILLQWLLFRRMYGGADCLAFSVCALFFTAWGQELLGFLYLMTITFAVLAIVQLIKKNVNKRGNLKEPVALIPYIAVAAVFYYSYIHYCILSFL